MCVFRTKLSILLFFCMSDFSHPHRSSSELTMTSDSLLEEGAPIVPEPPLPNWKPNQKQYQTDGERIETAFRKYFRKADTSLANDVNEIVVCHANVIRFGGLNVEITFCTIHI